MNSPQLTAKGPVVVHPGSINSPRPAPTGQPLISVIVASFNSASVIDRCIRSVAGQTYARKQLIIIDGQSTDGTTRILEKHSDKIHHWVSEPDRGISDAWNKGLAKADGDWICFLGCDDVFWEADVLERMAPHLASQPPDVRVVYASLCMLSPTQGITSVWGAPWERLRRQFLAGVMKVPHPGLMQHRSLFEEHGRFDESVRIVMDYEMLLRELATRDACFVPGLVAVGMGVGGNSHRLKNRFAARREVARVLKNHGLPRWTKPRLSSSAKLWSVAAMQKLLGTRASDSIRAGLRRQKLNARYARPVHPVPFVDRNPKGGAARDGG